MSQDLYLEMLRTYYAWVNTRPDIGEILSAVSLFDYKYSRRINAWNHYVAARDTYERAAKATQ